MKRINTLLLALLSVVTLTWTSCNDSIEYTPVGPVEGAGVYFPTSTRTSYELEGTSGSITLDVMRTDSVGALDATLTTTFTEGGESVFTVPASVSFADGASTSSMTINYDNLVQGTTYNVTMAFDEGTPYANSSLTLTFLYPEEVVYTWKEVSKNAILKESIFGFLSMSNVETTGIVVEKANEGNVYRFRVPFDNEYFYDTFEGNVFEEEPAPEEIPYIIVDGETYKDDNGNSLYYIAPTALGFSFSYDGQYIYIDTADKTTANFGSVAGNLSAGGANIPVTSTDYPLGSFDEKKQILNLGTVFMYVDGVGYQVIDSKTTDVYLALDPALLEPDYDRDYTWHSVPEATGFFTSELLGESWMQAVEQSDEDPTFYRMPNLYSNAEKAHVYFYIDEKGAVSIPRGQDTGLTTFGNMVRLEGTPNRSSYDAETGTLTLAFTFYLSNEDGDALADLVSVTETFLWGQSSEFVAADITDYVGNWLVTFESGEDGGQSPVTISQADATTLKVQGLSLMNPATYDDAMYLDYDAASGQVVFNFQQVAPDPEGYLGFVAPFNSAEGTLSMESLIGGLTRNGVLKFTDAPTNQGTYDSMIYLISPNGQQFGMMTGYWNYLEWEPYTETASTKSLKFAAPKTFKPTVNKGFTPRRTYKTELNIKPQPAQKRNASSLRTKMNVSLPAAGNNFSLVR